MFIPLLPYNTCMAPCSLHSFQCALQSAAPLIDKFKRQYTRYLYGMVPAAIYSN